MRFDLQVMASWVEPGARVLDLGCGEGDLLAYLIENKGIVGRGIERDEAKVATCIARGLSVLQGDINEEVADYADGTFDYVILSQTLQQVYDPALILRNILRIGRRGMVSFPNFGHWPNRLQLLLTGRTPITRALPYHWHDTPNIRVITIKDFRRFAREVGFIILREAAVSAARPGRPGRTFRRWANLLAPFCLFMIGRQSDRNPPPPAKQTRKSLL